jgi:hypothetical protein
MIKPIWIENYNAPKAAGKYTALNTDYDFARTDPQTDLRLEEIRQLFESYGVKTQIGG